MRLTASIAGAYPGAGIYGVSLIEQQIVIEDDGSMSLQSRYYGHNEAVEEPFMLFVIQVLENAK